jgi:hypothetical protein
MKIRWSRDSVRLRITPTEMATLMRGEEVGEELCFPGGAAWRVAVRAGAETTLTTGGDAALLEVSADDREALAAPDAEGIYFQTVSGLRYYVEKDFPCTHPRAAEALEPATETFAAPQGFEERKLETETEINGD